MPKTLTRDLTTRALTVRASTLDANTRSVEAVIATEKPSDVFDLRSFRVIREVLRTDGATFPKQVVMLDSHNRWSSDDVIGSVRDLRIEGDKLIGRAYFAKSDDNAERAWQKVKDGHITDFSAGYRVDEYEDIPPGETRTVADRNHTAPKNMALRVTTKWTLREASLVPIGADEAAKVRSENDNMPPELDQKPKTAEAVYTEEQQRAADIKAAGKDIPEHLVKRCIDEGLSVDESRKLFLRHLQNDRPAPVGVNINTSAYLNEPGQQERAMSTGLMHRCGVDPIDHTAPKHVQERQTRDAEIGERYSELSLMEIAKRSLALSGMNAPSSITDMVRAAVSTGSFSTILSNLNDAKLMQVIREVGDSTIGLATEGFVKNFRTTERPTVNGNTNLVLLGMGGTASHGSLSDSYEEGRVYRFALQYALDEMQIRNDDLGALMTFLRQFGTNAAKLKQDLFYSKLLANPTLTATGRALFNATDGNYGTSGTALAASTLEAGAAAMMKQTSEDPEGNVINHNPMAKHIVVPPDLDFVARKILRSVDRDDSSENGRGNPLRDLNIEIHVDNRMGAAGCTDPVTGTAQTGSATNWMLLASPNQHPVFEFLYLEGSRKAPEVRTYSLTQGQWGIGLDCKFDIGLAVLDYKGGYFATGAS